VDRGPKPRLVLEDVRLRDDAPLRLRKRKRHWIHVLAQPGPGLARRGARFCRDAVNADRATLSLVALKSWADSLPCISRQTDLDAATGTAHAHFGICAESAQNTCPGWPTDTTFTREAATLKSCLASMWAEGPGSDYSTHGHYINMTNTGYTKVGCGFHTDDGATAWIDIDFR